MHGPVVGSPGEWSWRTLRPSHDLGFLLSLCSTPSTKALGQLVGQLIFFLALYLGGRPTATKNFNLPLTVYSYTAGSRRGMNPVLSRY